MQVQWLFVFEEIKGINTYLKQLENMVLLGYIFPSFFQ